MRRSKADIRDGDPGSLCFRSGVRDSIRLMHRIDETCIIAVTSRRRCEDMLVEKVFIFLPIHTQIDSLTPFNFEFDSLSHRENSSRVAVMEKAFQRKRGGKK